VARRSKDGSIIINVGSDAQRHLDRVAKRERVASERAAKREAKRTATRQRQALSKWLGLFNVSATLLQDAKPLGKLVKIGDQIQTGRSDQFILKALLQLKNTIVMLVGKKEPLA